MPGLLLHRRRREDELVHAALAERERQVLAARARAGARAGSWRSAPRSRTRRAGPRRRASGCRRTSARRRRSCPGSRAAGRSTAGGRRRGRTAGRRASSVARDRPGRGRNGSMRSRHRDRAGARAAAAVRLGERLVQVEVDDVEAHVARAATAHDRVEVRAVVVERRADARGRSRRSPRCSGRTRPSVFGFVSIRQATSSSAFARRSSMSTPPSAFVPTLTTS